jgi:hypothetical protein
MNKRISSLLACVGLFTVTCAHAELVILDESVAPQFDGYVHPALRSLVFQSPESRGQAILPVPSIIVASPPLIYRAPGPIMPLYPPVTMSGFNRPGAPANLDMANYSLARAHAMSQNLYRREGSSVYFGGNPWIASYAWGYSPYLPVPTGRSHPSNRDNNIYLLDRAHRFSQDAYRKP